MPEDVHRRKVKERDADMTVEGQLKGGRSSITGGHTAVLHAACHCNGIILGHC